MKGLLNTPIRLATLVLVTVVFAGCGQGNPVSPVSSLAPNLATDQVALPIDGQDEGISGGGGSDAPATIIAPPGRRLGHDKPGSADRGTKNGYGKGKDKP